MAAGVDLTTAPEMEDATGLYLVAVSPDGPSIVRLPSGVITDAASTSAVADVKKLIGEADGIAKLDADGLIPVGSVRGTVEQVVFFDGMVSGVDASAYDTTPASSSGGSGLTHELVLLTVGLFYDRSSNRMLLQEFSASLTKPGKYYYWKSGCREVAASVNARGFARVMAAGGAPRSDVLYVDRSTGQAWRYDGKALVRVGREWTADNVYRAISIADLNALLEMRPLAMRQEGAQMWRVVENDAIVATAEWYSRYSPDDGECLGGEMRVRGYGIVRGAGSDYFAYDPTGDGAAYREWSMVDGGDHWETPVEVTPLTVHDAMGTQKIHDLWNVIP